MGKHLTTNELMADINCERGEMRVLGEIKESAKTRFKKVLLTIAHGVNGTNWGPL